MKREFILGLLRDGEFLLETAILWGQNHDVQAFPCFRKFAFAHDVMILRPKKHLHL